MTLRRLFALFAMAALSLGASPAPTHHGNWNATIAVTPSGSHILGNPEAPVKLTEYVSYTCPHCAHFEQQAADALGVIYVGPGKLQIEVRHLLRDPIDATIAQLTNCGPKEKFYLNHDAFLRTQENWIKPLENPSSAQRARWTTGPMAARRRAIASDFKFYDIMERRGYRQTDVDRCLADDALAQRLAAQTKDAIAAGVTGTPSFAINDELLADTHSWEVLAPQLSARID
jgi:protein-disulfide isomerase